MAYADGWYCFAAITIDHTKCGPGVSAAHVFYLTEDNLPDMMLDADGPFPAKADGGDIRFSTDLAGAVPTPFHIVEFTLNNNPALASANIWVCGTSDAVQDKVLYVWWRNADANALPVADTYGQYETWKHGTDCYARWMCDDGEDASVNNADFATSDVVFAAGVIDNCAVFDEDENASHTFLASQTEIWWTGWVYVDSGAAGGDTVFSCDPFIMWINLAGAGFKFKFVAGFDDTDGEWRAEVELAFDTWHHVAVSYDGGAVANDPYWAINKATPAQLETSTPVGTLDSGSTTGYLARRAAGQPMPGKLDEISLKLTKAPSAAVTLGVEITDYNNQDDPANFSSAGLGQIVRKNKLRV